MQILDVDLPNSSVQPGFVHTARFSIVPNDILSGQQVVMRAWVGNGGTGRPEFCVKFLLTIHAD